MVLCRVGHSFPNPLAAARIRRCAVGLAKGRGPGASVGLSHRLLPVFLCYIDLLPTGLWRYFNIHYFKWTLPGFGLLGWLLLGDLRLRRRTAWVALAVVLILSCIRVTPRPAVPNEPAVAVDIPGPQPPKATQQ